MGCGVHEASVETHQRHIPRGDGDGWSMVLGVKHQVRLDSAAVTAQPPLCCPHVCITLRDGSLCWALFHVAFAPGLRQLSDLGVE